MLCEVLERRPHQEGPSMRHNRNALGAAALTQENSHDSSNVNASWICQKKSLVERIAMAFIWTMCNQKKCVYPA